MVSIAQAAAGVKPRRAKAERKAGPRTKMGAKGIRVRDLVHVKDPRDAGQEFTAAVTGGYTLDQQWIVQLGPVPGARPESPRPPRQSTPARCVVQVYKRGT